MLTLNDVVGRLESITRHIQVALDTQTRFYGPEFAQLIQFDLTGLIREIKEPDSMSKNLEN